MRSSIAGFCHEWPTESHAPLLKRPQPASEDAAGSAARTNGRSSRILNHQIGSCGNTDGSFWLRLPPTIPLTEAKIEVPVCMAGVLIRGTSSHLVIHNLTATRPYNDGFNLSDSRDIRLENIQAVNCGDDGISAHGHCQYSVKGFHSIGNATGICDTGTSETTYDDVLIRNCIGFDPFFLDSGIHTVRNAQVISSAAKALYLEGPEPPAAPCRVTLDNVVIRREETANEVRVLPTAC